MELLARAERGTSIIPSPGLEGAQTTQTTSFPPVFSAIAIKVIRQRELLEREMGKHAHRCLRKSEETRRRKVELQVPLREDLPVARWQVLLAQSWAPSPELVLDRRRILITNRDSLLLPSGERKPVRIKSKMDVG